ncbi:MAG: ECF transporter S component [Alistipes sp.]|nr:ECF transporter S component [Alistipes sp.]
MNTTSVKLYSLNYGQAKTYAVAALFVLGNIALPQLCHLLPQGGQILLPIYFFTLLGACKYGWKVGLLTAVASPLANSLMFGMPAAAALPAILAKSVLLAVAAGYAVARYRKVSLLLLAGAVLFSQILGTAFEWAVTGSLYGALQDFRMGVPGIMLQIFGCWAAVKYLLRK